MHIIITTDKKVVNALIDTTADVVNEFRPDGLSAREIDHAKRSASKRSYIHRGPAYEWEYSVHSEDNEPDISSFEMDIEDDAILMYLPMAVKISKVLSPFYDMGRSLVKMIRNLQGQFDSISSKYNSKFQEKFGKTKTYTVGAVWCEDLELFDQVVVEDDGFGNRHVIHAEHCGKINSMRVIEKFAMAAIERGEKTKDSMTHRYPRWEFREITRDEAVKECRKCRRGLQADVDRFYDKTEDAEDDEPINDQGCAGVDSDAGSLDHSDNGSADSKYALVICGIDTGYSYTDYRRYAVILDQCTNAPIEDITAMCDMPNGQTVDLSKIADVVTAKSRIGEIRYEYDSIADVRDAILIMLNDKTYYSTKCTDKRINLMQIDMGVAYKKTEE